MVLMLAGAGLWGYNNFFKSDPEIQQQLNNQFGEDFFKSFFKTLNTDFSQVLFLSSL